MATFNTQSFIEYDDYMTPLYAWEWIKQYIPNDKVIWEAFYGDGSSGEFLKELGFNIWKNKVLFMKLDLKKSKVSSELNSTLIKTVVSHFILCLTISVVLLI